MIMQTKKKIYLFIIWAAVACMCGCAAQGKHSVSQPDNVTISGTPQIVFENQKHDFGRVQYKAGVLKHTFVFKNTGAAPLLIEKVKAG